MFHGRNIAFFWAFGVNPLPNRSHINTASNSRAWDEWRLMGVRTQQVTCSYNDSSRV